MKRKLRTIAKNLKTKERVLVTLLFAFVLSCMSIGYAYYQTELNLEANIRLLKGDLEITSASVYKTKNSSLVGELGISRSETNSMVALLSEYTVELTGLDKNNYFNVRYIITNNSNKTYTYTKLNNYYANYTGANPADLRAPKLYGIIPGDKILPGETRTVDLIYIASSDVETSTFNVIPSFIFDSSDPEVAVPSMNTSLDSHNLILGDDNLASVGIEIINGFETTVKYTLTINTDKYELTNSSGSSSNFSNTLEPGDLKKTKIYFKLLDQSVANEDTSFDLTLTLEDGTVYYVGNITIGKNVVPDLTKVIAKVNEENSHDITGWTGHYILNVDITNNYDVDINSWTVYAYPKESSSIVSAGSSSNTVSFEDGVIKITSKELYSDNLIKINKGTTYTTGDITIEYGGPSFEIEKFVVVANVENVDPDVNTYYKEKILNGADPVLPTGNENFIPVIISDNGTVTRARISDEWYKYSEQRWANAVLLKEGFRYNYYYAEGETVDTRDIAGYFVWIPRYKYELFNVTTTNNKIDPISINIFFENTNTTPSTGNTNGSYLTHPAFTYINKNGFWFGKFELTTDYNTLPNVTPMRNVSIFDLYNSSLNYKSALNSHMMTNMEWGAVTYLTYSKYGRGTTEVSINNTSTTGGGSFGSLNSYPQSTTGNITGVFDMNGCSAEYVTSTITGVQSGNYSTFYDSLTDYKLGDAITETAGWFNDARSYFTTTEQYLVRGGNYKEGTNAGLNYYWHRNGNAGNNDSSRMALDI